jgi:hypothetical protein
MAYTRGLFDLLVPRASLSRDPLALALCGVVVIATWFRNIHYLEVAHFSDVLHGYVPAAMSMRDLGVWGYLSHPDALRVVPGPILWLWLWDLQLDKLRAFHHVVHALCVLPLAAAAYRVQGRLAALGAAVAWFYAPEIGLFMSHAMSETPYLAPVTFWIWALVRWLQTGQRRMLFVLFILAGMAALSRPMLIYPTACVLLLVLVLRVVPPLRRAATVIDLSEITIKRTIIAMAVSLLVALGWMTMNKALHGQRAIASGSGVGLYLGLHPLTNGLEPAVFRLTYDVTTLARGDHLTPAADRVMMESAREFLKMRSAAEWADFLVMKAGTIAFFDPQHRQYNPRDPHWRIIVLSLSLIGFFLTRKRAEVWLLSALTALLFAQQLPVLTNVRYSVASLEPFLCVLAAVGAASLLQTIWRATERSPRLSPRWTAALSLAVLAGAGATAQALKQPGFVTLQPMANVRGVPVVPIADVVQPRVARAYEATVDASHRITGEAPRFAGDFELAIPRDIEKRQDASANGIFWEITLSLQRPFKKECDTAEVFFTPSVGQKTKLQSERFRFPQRDGQQVVRVSAAQRFSNVSPAQSGVMHFIVECPEKGAQIQIERIRLMQSLIPEMAVQRLAKRGIAFEKYLPQ